MKTGFAVLALLASVSVVAAQPSLSPELIVIASAITAGQPLSPELAASLKTWVEPTDPVKIVGPIHYVGTRGLGAYLITTDEGHILIDGGMPSSAEDIEASIRKLGFKPEDIKLLLITHAHIDHAGTTAHFKELSGAEVAVMDRDFDLLKSGGKSDPVYGSEPSLRYPGVTAERVLKDGDMVSLGAIRLTARLGAGHTPGATTWVTTVEDKGRTYNVVFPCCTEVSPGYRLTLKPSYPGIVDDYRQSFTMLESLRPDIWLAAHAEAFRFEDKRKHTADEGVLAWVDAQGYHEWVAAEKAKFEAMVANETATQ